MHKNLGRNKGWLHWGRSRHLGHQGCKKRDLLIVYIFVFQVLCHLHILTIQNEFLKTKSLHKIQQRKGRKENVREGQKWKGKKKRIWKEKVRKKNRNREAFNHCPIATKLFRSEICFSFYPSPLSLGLVQVLIISWQLTTTDVFAFSLIPMLSAQTCPPSSCPTVTSSVDSTMYRMQFLPASPSLTLISSYLAFEITATLNHLFFL